MPKKDMKNYYEVRIANAAWQTGYYASTYKEAIHDFLKDPLYTFADGIYEVEVVKTKKVYKVEKKTQVITNTTVKFL